MAARRTRRFAQAARGRGKGASADDQDTGLEHGKHLCSIHGVERQNFGGGNLLGHAEKRLFSRHRKAHERLRAHWLRSFAVPPPGRPPTRRSPRPAPPGSNSSAAAEFWLSTPRGDRSRTEFQRDFACAAPDNSSYVNLIAPSGAATAADATSALKIGVWDADL